MKCIRNGEVLVKHLSFALVFLAGSVSWGWGFVGHRTTGYVADAFLSPQARQATQALLQGRSLAEAAEWPDTLRSDPNFKHVSKYHFEGVPDRVTYLDDLRHKPPEKRAEGGVMTAILFAETQLQDPKVDPAQKSMSLKFLIHFIGDLHQPMHTGRAEDFGGNAIKFPWFGQDSNLHSVWDTGMLLTGHADLFKGQPANADYAVIYARWLLQQMRSRLPNPQSIGRLESWLGESMAARVPAYDPRMTGAQDAYQRDNLPIFDERVYFAGLRIAETLNRLFANQPMSAFDSQLLSQVQQISGLLPTFITLGPRKAAPGFRNSGPDWISYYGF